MSNYGPVQKTRHAEVSSVHSEHLVRCCRALSAIGSAVFAKCNTAHRTHRRSTRTLRILCGSCIRHVGVGWKLGNYKRRSALETYQCPGRSRLSVGTPLVCEGFHADAGCPESVGDAGDEPAPRSARVSHRRMRLIVATGSLTAVKPSTRQCIGGRFLPEFTQSQKSVTCWRTAKHEWELPKQLEWAAVVEIIGIYEVRI